MADSVVPATRVWLAEAMRLTVFFAPGTDLSVDKLKEWWKAVTGSDPESLASEKHGMLNRLKGSFAAGRLELAASARRLDWNLSALPIEVGDSPIGVPSLGARQEVQDAFLKLARTWLPQSPAFKRIALGETLVFPVPDKAAAVAALVDRIATIDFKGELQDLVYKVNRPQEFVTNGVTIKVNRLQTWSPIVYGAVLGLLDVQGIQMRPVSGVHAAQLELDLNTDPTVEPPQAAAVPIIDKLAELADQIAEQGDIP